MDKCTKIGSYRITLIIRKGYQGRIINRIKEIIKKNKEGIKNYQIKKTGDGKIGIS